MAHKEGRNDATTPPELAPPDRARSATADLTVRVRALELTNFALAQVVLEVHTEAPGETVTESRSRVRATLLEFLESYK